MRRRTFPHYTSPDEEIPLSIDDILTSLKQLDLADDIQVVRAVQDIYKHPLLNEILSMPEHMRLKEELVNIKPDDARALIEQLQSIPCAEAGLVEYSAELTHAVSSNTAPYFLGVGKTAIAAMFYLVKYFKKEAGAPNTALSVLIDARDHINEYGSKGSDANTPQHFARHVLTRSVNKGDQEMSGTQSASVTMGYKSFHCSDISGYVDNKCVFVRAKEICAECPLASSEVGQQETNVSEASAMQFELMRETHSTANEKKSTKNRIDDDSCMDDEAFNSSAHDGIGVDNDDRGEASFQNHENGPEIFSFDSDDEEFSEALVSSSSKMYTIPKDDTQRGNVRAVAVSQDMNYEHRGVTLSSLNYVEYCSMISIEKHSATSSRYMTVFIVFDAL